MRKQKTNWLSFCETLSIVGVSGDAISRTKKATGPSKRDKIQIKRFEFLFSTITLPLFHALFSNCQSEYRCPLSKNFLSSNTTHRKCYHTYSIPSTNNFPIYPIIVFLPRFLFHLRSSRRCRRRVCRFVCRWRLFVTASTLQPFLPFLSLFFNKSTKRNKTQMDVSDRHFCVN